MKKQGLQGKKDSRKLCEKSPIRKNSEKMWKLNHPVNNISNVDLNFMVIFNVTDARSVSALVDNLTFFVFSFIVLNEW